MEIEPFIPSEPASPADGDVDAEAGAPPEPTLGPDRDRIALEALEAELAVLEDELARVDAPEVPT